MTLRCDVIKADVQGHDVQGERQDRQGRQGRQGGASGRTWSAPPSSRSWSSPATHGRESDGERALVVNPVAAWSRSVISPAAVSAHSASPAAAALPDRWCSHRR